jgi:addiction module HigA family antidote
LKSLIHSEAPPHPGEILREDILPKTGLGTAELAQHLDVPPAVVDELVREQRPVSLDLALRLGAALGQGARYWLGLQALHDIWQAEQPQAQPARVKPVRWGKRKARGELAPRAA